MYFLSIFLPLYIVKIDLAKHFCFSKMIQLITKKVRPIFNGPSIGLFGATLKGVWQHSFCPSYYPQNGGFTTVKGQIKHLSADSCSMLEIVSKLVKFTP